MSFWDIWIVDYLWLSNGFSSSPWACKILLIFWIVFFVQKIWIHFPLLIVEKFKSDICIENCIVSASLPAVWHVERIPVGIVKIRLAIFRFRICVIVEEQEFPVSIETLV